MHIHISFMFKNCLNERVPRTQFRRKHNDNNNNNSMAVSHDQDIICMFETGFLHIWLVKYSVI